MIAWRFWPVGGFLALSSSLLLAACEDPRNGIVTFYNDSDETIFVIDAGGMDATLEGAGTGISYNYDFCLNAAMEQ